MSSSDFSESSSSSSSDVTYKGSKQKAADSSSDYYDGDSSDIYEVEEILKHKIVGKKKIYFIKWKGYPHSENTWEEEKNLLCPEKLNEYWKKYEKMESAINHASKAIKIPREVLSAKRTSKGLIYSVKYSDGSIGELDSPTIKKLNPLIAIDYLESLNEFSDQE